jgi:hypothetical protein
MPAMMPAFALDLATTITIIAGSFKTSSGMMRVSVDLGAAFEEASARAGIAERGPCGLQATTPTDNYFSADRSRRALLTTDNELKLIAAPAIIGFSRSPKNG